MDAPLNPLPDESRLAALFQEAGPLTAPDGMEERLLQRIAVLPCPSGLSVRPLLPRWSLFVGGMVLLGLMLISIRAGGAMATDQSASGLARALGNEWLLGAALCMACLAALDRVLVRSRISSI